MTKNRDIRHELEHRILLLDGGFGTMIQQYGLDEADYRGKEFAASEKLLRGCNDLLNLTRPETIREIHEKYLQAGSDVITSNTFNANSISLADYGLAAEAYRINRVGAAIAREVADITIGANDLYSLLTLRRLSCALMDRIHTNYRNIIGFNFMLICLGVAGILPPATSALLHNMSTLAIGLKSMTNLLPESEQNSAN